MTDITSCPTCGSKQFSDFHSCIDYTVSHETFKLRECTTCQMLITTPRPDDNDLGKYYQSKDYISHSNKAASLIDKIYLIARHYTLRKKLNLISNYKHQGTLLDYGCGTGEFINICKSNGWEIKGVEPSTTARAKASELTGEKITESIQDIDSQHDVITLWHVLEHVPDLERTVDALYSRLKENGIIFIAVPNYKSFDAQHYKNYWAAYDVPRHLWHFDQNSMKELLTKKQFTLEKIVPMKLDSFYVSLLSEKYKNNQLSSVSGMIKAFLTGLKSNMKAKKNGNYSSLIYIARK